jgi:hypothetical protein
VFLGATLALVAVLGGSASAATAHPSAQPLASGRAHASDTAVPATSLAGYQQVSNAYLAGFDTQASGTATCPSGTELVGGGVSLEDTPALTQAIVTSAPSAGGGTWHGTVDNPIMAGSDFIVWAECVTKIAKYAIVAGTTVDNPAGAQTSASASCPAGTVALGGGGQLSSSSTAVSLNDDYPLAKGKGWHVDANNASGADNSVQAYAICGKKPAKYAVVKGPGAAVGASARGKDTAICASGSTVLGGGGDSSSGSTTVDLSGTGPSGTNAWLTYVSDTSSASSTVTAYAICTKLKS